MGGVRVSLDFFAGYVIGFGVGFTFGWITWADSFERLCARVGQWFAEFGERRGWW